MVKMFHWGLYVTMGGKNLCMASLLAEGPNISLDPGVNFGVHDMIHGVQHDGMVVTVAGLRQCRIFAAPHRLAEVFNPGV